jgi:hypothetical protein
LSDVPPEDVPKLLLPDWLPRLDVPELFGLPELVSLELFKLVVPDVDPDELESLFLLSDEF